MLVSEQEKFGFLIRANYLPKGDNFRDNYEAVLIERFLERNSSLNNFGLFKSNKVSMCC